MSVKTYESLDDMPPGAVVGTSSLRRESQIHAVSDDAGVTSLRGNPITRLRKLDEGQYDVIIPPPPSDLSGLPAASGSTPLPDVSPAAGQALGIEALSDRPQLSA